VAPGSRMTRAGPFRRGWMPSGTSPEDLCMIAGDEPWWFVHWTVAPLYPLGAWALSISGRQETSSPKRALAGGRRRPDAREWRRRTPAAHNRTATTVGPTARASPPSIKVTVAGTQTRNRRSPPAAAGMSPPRRPAARDTSHNSAVSRQLLTSDDRFIESRYAPHWLRGRNVLGARRNVLVWTGEHPWSRGAVGALVVSDPGRGDRGGPDHRLADGTARQPRSLTTTTSSSAPVSARAHR
jgi:hypothetical protein